MCIYICAVHTGFVLFISFTQGGPEVSKLDLTCCCCNYCNDNSNDVIVMITFSKMKIVREIQDFSQKFKERITVELR